MTHFNVDFRIQDVLSPLLTQLATYDEKKGNCWTFLTNRGGFTFNSDDFYVSLQCRHTFLASFFKLHGIYRLLIDS